MKHRSDRSDVPAYVLDEFVDAWRDSERERLRMERAMVEARKFDTPWCEWPEEWKR